MKSRRSFLLALTALIGPVAGVTMKSARAGSLSGRTGYEFTLISFVVGSAADYYGKSNDTELVSDVIAFKNLQRMGVSSIQIDPKTQVIRGTLSDTNGTLFSDAVPVQTGFLIDHVFCTTGDPLSHGARIICQFSESSNMAEMIMALKMQIDGFTYKAFNGPDATGTVSLPDVVHGTYDISLLPFDGSRNVTLFPGVYLDGDKAIMVGIATRKAPLTP